MKETRVRIRSSVECVGVKCPGLSRDDCLVEDAVADRYDQCLETLGDRNGYSVAAEGVRKQPVVGDCDLCTFLDLQVSGQEAPAGASREELGCAALVVVDVDASAWRACAADNVEECLHPGMDLAEVVIVAW